MIEADFGEQGGGRLKFKTSEALVEYIQTQINEWVPTLEAGPPDTWDGADVIRNWIAVRDATSEISEGELSATLFNAHTHAPGQLIAAHSTLGQSLADLVDADREIGLSAAGFAASPPTARARQISKTALSGAILAQMSMVGADVNAVNGARAEWEALSAEHRNSLMEGRNDAELARQAVSELLRSIESNREKEVLRANTAQASMRAQHDANQEQMTSDWKAIADAFNEQLKLESAVTLWTTRKSNHAADAGGRRSLALVVGALGLLAAGFVAWAAIDFAHWLFSGAIVDPSKTLESGLRPTFHFELILASSSTLLYLTMYLWTMRILVRTYMTEHHLAIDAGARATMAETYLALIKDEAASEADRAIILGSLFRPVVDGIVKDDGLPTVSPAAMLAGILSGKQGS